jgi:acetyl-CoA C-acetyltransferase
MMHAVARMVVLLRERGENGLIVANGGYATHSHSLVLTRRQVPPGTFPQDYSVQAIADARRGTTPELLDDHEGEGTIETYTVPFDRHGKPRGATVIARTPDGRRFLASVAKDDETTLELLMGAQGDPVGRRGWAERVGEAIHWRVGSRA